MATNTVTTSVQIVGNALSLTKATKTAKKDMSSLSGVASNVSSKVNGLLGAIGVGISFAAIGQELQTATKAAVEDAKSSALLAKQLKNTTGATKEQTAAVEKNISKMSIMAGVADDKIRPAFATLIRYTKDQTKASKLMNLALDVSAGTGKDVETVAKALGKAYDGNTGALGRLGISVKKGSDWMAELKDQFKGAAETAANNDPYQRMKIVLDELQEQIGSYFLPKLTELAKWFANNFDNIKNAIDGMFNSKPVKALGDILRTVWEKIFIPIGEWFMSKEIQKAFGGFFDNVSRVLTSVGDFLGSPLGQFIGWLTSKALLAALQTVSGLIGGIADAMDRLMGKNVPAPSYGGAPLTGNVGTKYSFMDAINKGVGNLSTVGGKVTNNNSITINTKANAKDTVDELDRYFNRLGVKWR